MRKEWEHEKTEKHALTVRIALLVMLDILFMQVASLPVCGFGMSLTFRL